MALFNLGGAGDISLLTDWKKLQSYMYKQNEMLKYMFNNLTPDDNYSKEAYEHYMEEGENASVIKQTVDKISLEMLTSDNVVSAINLSTEGVQIQGDKISLEGTVTVNGYFKVGLDGSIEAVNGRFSGDISGSTISGSAIEVGGSSEGAGEIVVYGPNGKTYSDILVQMDEEGIAVFGGSIDVGLFHADSEYVSLGPLQIGMWDATNWRYTLMTEDQSIGICTSPSEWHNKWMWAGYEQERNYYKFQVNAAGEVWAEDICMNGVGSLKDYIDDQISSAVSTAYSNGYSDGYADGYADGQGSVTPPTP